MNTSYGYNQNDHNWVEPRELIVRLVDIVSKGGNYLLNVGPTAEGLIPQPSVERLQDFGKWMAVNAEAIYGTSAWKVTHEQAAAGQPVAVRFTAKGDAVYAICLTWPAQDLLIKALGTPGRAVAAVRMLAHPIPFSGSRPTPA